LFSNRKWWKDGLIRNGKDEARIQMEITPQDWSPDLNTLQVAHGISK